LINLVLTISKN